MLGNTRRIRRFATRTGIVSCLLSPLAAATPVFGGEPMYLVETAAGFAIPFQSKQRDHFGNAAVFSVAGAHRPGHADTWIFVEVGLVHSSGFTYDPDPTFLFGETEQWLLPLTIGVRAGLSTPDRVRGRVYAGIGLRIVPAWRDDPLRGTESGAALGLVVEMRHDFALAERFGLFVQPRFVLLSPVDYGRIQDVDHTSLNLEVGTSFGRAAGTLRRY